MDLFSRKHACSSSPPKLGAPVRRHASCPLAPKPREARAKRRHDTGHLLAELFRPKKLKKAPSRVPGGLIGGGSRNQAEGKAEKPPFPVAGAVQEASIPLRAQSLPSLSPPELAAADPAALEEPSKEKASLSASTRLPGPSEPMMEPQLLPHKKLALHASIECLPTAGAVPPLPQEPRMFWRTFGKGMKAADQRRKESKYVQTQPLYQDYWGKRLKAVQHKPRDQAFRVDASLSVAGLLSSSLLSAASHASQRDYSFAFWQELPEVKTRGLLEGIAPRQRHLQEAMFEMITSEASYLRSLLVAVLHFQNSPVLQRMLSMAELHRLFSNLPQVKDVSERFLLELEEHLDQDVFLPGLGDVVLRHCPAFHRAYIPYVTNQMYQEQLLQQLMQENSCFLQVLRQLEEQPICQRQPLKSFLVLPFQRITRLKILLQNILKLAPGDSDLANAIELAHKAVGEIVCRCNENVRLMQQTEELVMLEKLMDFARVKALPLISRGRWLVREGELSQVLAPEAGLSYRLRASVKPLHLHLFTDLLLLSQRKEDGRFLVKDYAQTAHVKAEQFKAAPSGLAGWTFRLALSQNHTGGSTELVLKAASEAQRQEWISLLAGN